MEQQVKKISVYVFITMLLVALLVGVAFFTKTPTSDHGLGSVARGSEYHYTTATSTSYINPVIKSVPGALGSVTVNLLGTASITFYDATTTNANLRAKATSTLPVLAYIAPSQAAGTYTYDVAFFDGLLAVWGTGTVASTTITWR